MISYGHNNALESFISYISLLNRVGQFDEINAQFFENNSYDIVPSHMHQELWTPIVPINSLRSINLSNITTANVGLT